MFQKIIGIIGALAVLGVIAMVAVSPKAEGFFPGMFHFMNRKPQMVVPDLPPVDSGPVALPADTLSIAPEEPLLDSAAVE